MEQGEIKDYTQTEQIDRVRREHAQRHTSTGKDTVKNASKRNNSKSMVCASIITRELAHNKTHTKPKGLCTGTCVLSVSQRMAKISNTLRWIAVTSKNQDKNCTYRGYTYKWEDTGLESTQ